MRAGRGSSRLGHRQSLTEKCQEKYSVTVFEVQRKDTTLIAKNQIQLRRQNLCATRRTFLLRLNSKNSMLALKQLSTSICSLRPSVINNEEGEFPSGSLWGVCVETVANITSQSTKGNRKFSICGY
jgi:hypothetical protein